jgi:CelD/BcsL family acetyltransferase involved in cellulose biosynthesis
MIEIIQDKISLVNLKKEWNNLAKTFGSPLLCHEWFYSCANAFYKESNLRIVIVRSKKEICAIAPLAKKKKGPFEYLEILGSSYLGEHSGFLYRDEQSLRTLMDGIIQLNRPFYLHRFSFDSPLTKLLSDTKSKRGIFIKRNTSGSPYVPICGTWDRFYGSLSPKRRYNLKYGQKIAKKIGNYNISIFNPQYKELKYTKKIAFEIEGSGWKGKRGSSILYNQKLHTFYNSYINEVNDKDIIRFGFLFLNEIPVAMVFGLEYQNRFWLLKIGYDEKYSKCSPGNLLIHETIRYAFDKGLRSYELLGSDEPWKRIWAKNNIRKYISLGFYTANIHGLAALFGDLKRFGVGKLSGLYKRQK